MAGTPINWDTPKGDSILQHPLYIKWNNKSVNELVATLPVLKADLGLIMATKQNAPIIAYISWLLRIAGLAQ